MEKYRGTQATLYGVRSANALNVVTFMNQPVADDENYENILPGGLERIGVLAVSIDEINTENNEIAIIKKDDKLQCHILKDGAFKPVAHKVVDSLDLAVLRLQTKFSIQLSTKEEETDGFLEKLLNKLESNAASFLMYQSSVVHLNFIGLLFWKKQAASLNVLPLYIIKRVSLIIHSQLSFTILYATLYRNKSGYVPLFVFGHGFNHSLV